MSQESLIDFDAQRKASLDFVVKRGLEFFTKHHRSTSNKRMSFLFMPYLYKMYHDKSPKIAVMSSVQTGKSEFILIKGLACVDMGLNVFHVFSTGEAKNSFVKSRINELCDKVPVYKQMERDDRRNMYLRAMGKANWKFVISNSKTHFDEFPADVVVIDEKDSCNQENIRLADTRQENSLYKFQWYVGNPSVTNTGISEDFERSTKNEWYYTCVGCGEKFEADFFKVVVNEIKDKDGNHVAYELFDKEWTEYSLDDIKMKCPHCDCLQARGKGRWIETEPKAKMSGYHISKLMKLNSRIEELWVELKDAEGNDFKMQVFYNKKLGLPYSGTGSKITGEMLDFCAYSYTAKDSCVKPTIAGLDIGSKFDLQIDISAKHDGRKKKLLLNAFRLNSLEEVKEKVAEFNIRTMCVGVKPERHLVAQLRDDLFGICDVILIEEVEGRSGNLKLFGFKEDEENGVITVDRTWMLDEGIKNVKFQNMLLPKEFRGLLDGYWLRSMESLTRIFENEKEEYRWSKADHDHFVFANAFSTIAWMRDQEAIIVGEDLEREGGKKKTDERGNRVIETTERKERVGLFRERYSGARKGWKSRRR